MTVYDGNTTNDTRMYGKYCGRLIRFTIYGTTNQMMIYAKTDDTIAKVFMQYRILSLFRAVT